MFEPGAGARGIGQLLRDLANESAELVRSEIALAKAEMTEKVTRASAGIAMLVIGGVVAFAGLLVLLDAAVYALAKMIGSDGLPALAALIVGVVTIGLGGLLIVRGRSAFRPKNLAPERTVQSLQRDGQLVKEQMP
ncbi:MAG: phage holin family protein [Geminicoccaceae bacterium]|nr:phage holin family protein [Geminicoccaceae bacterium]